MRWKLAIAGGTATTLLVLLSGLAGTAAGIGAYAFVYAKGASYLTNDPKACANCHIMQEQFEGWTRSSHHAVAVCNDCHAPHNLLGKLWVKAKNGFNHSFAFTTGYFHEPIQATPANIRVTEASCRYCHQPIVDAIDPAHAGIEQLSCIRCHRNVGHLH